MKKQKFTCILLAIILLFIFSVSSFASNVTSNLENATSNGETNAENTQNKLDQSTIDELNNLNQQKNDLQLSIEKVNSQLEYVQTEMSASLLQIQELNDKIIQYQEENNNLELELQTLQNSITEETKKLEIVTTEFNHREEQLRKRLVALYEAGEIEYIDVLLSAESLSEFLSMYYVMVEIAEYDNELMDKVDEQRKEIEETKQTLEVQTAKAKEIKAKAEQSETILKNTKVVQQKYVAQLTEEEAKLNDEIIEYKNDLIIIEAKIQEINILNGDINIQYLGGEMIWPVAIAGTAITSHYGSREHPIDGIVKLHQGIDIGNTGFGAPVVAVMDGFVTYAGPLGSYGNCVMIYHGNGITTVYAHGQTILTEGGKEVKQGDVIMQTGSTGHSTGPHLHFEVRINGITQNPLNYFKIRYTKLKKFIINV